METQDWKSNLGKSLSDKQIFRQDFIDKQSEAFCKKWASYVSEFGDFRASYTLDYLNPKFQHLYDSHGLVCNMFQFHLWFHQKRVWLRLKLHQIYSIHQVLR